MTRVCILAGPLAGEWLIGANRTLSLIGCSLIWDKMTRVCVYAFSLAWVWLVGSSITYCLIGLTGHWNIISWTCCKTGSLGWRWLIGSNCTLSLRCRPCSIDIMARPCRSLWSWGRICHEVTRRCNDTTCLSRIRLIISRWTGSLRGCPSSIDVVPCRGLVAWGWSNLILPSTWWTQRIFYTMFCIYVDCGRPYLRCWCNWFQVDN